MRERRSSSTARIVAGGLLALAAAWAIACSEAGTGPEPGPPPPPPTLNRPPAAVGAIPGQEVGVGDSLHFTVSSYFTDPDGDALTYDAGSSNPGVATAAAAMDLVTLAAVARGAATITVTATDPDGLEASQRFEVTVPNRGPRTIAPLPELELALGDEATVDVSSHFTDPDGDALTYGAASSDPAVAAAAPAGGAVTVRALSRGRATITVTAVDPDGLEAALAFDVTVLNSGPEPSGTLPDLELALGDEATVDVSSHFTDPDGDALTYRAASSDPAVTAGDTAGSAIRVRALSRGTATITVTASDPEGLEASLGFEVTVPNSGPEASGTLPDLELALGDEATLDVSSHFMDPDGDALTYRAASSDPAVAAAAAVGSAVTVRARSRGGATISVTAVDPDGLEATLAFDVSVLNSGPEPSGTLPDLELALGDEATVEVSSHFTDPDGDALTYRAASSDRAVAAAAPAGSAVTVRALSRGGATISVTAVDPDGLEATLAFDVTVLNSGPESSGTLPDLELALGDEATVEVSSHFTDPDGDALTYRAASSDPAVAAVDASGSEVTVRVLARGTATITVTASDPDGLEASLGLEVTVPNSGPGASGTLPDLELALGDEATVDVSPHFTDPDGDALTYRAASSDSDVSAVDTAGSAIRVRALSRGTAAITVTASDPDGLEASLGFEVTVPNSGPGASGTLPDLELGLGDEATVDVSSHFSDPDGDALTYRAASSHPAVAAVDASGGDVTVRALSRGTATITVMASDPDGLEAALEFGATVPNSPPGATDPIPDSELAWGEERTLDVSSHFTDPDGDLLTYRAASSNPAVAVADAAGSQVTVLALARGSTTIAVTASDPDGLEATLEFEVTVPGGGPVTVGRIPDLELAPGVRRSVDVSPYFSDPDDDPLTFAAGSSNPDVATATASGHSVAVLALTRGTATITVTATDPSGLETFQSFEVTVLTAPNRPPGITATLPDLDLEEGEEHMLLLSRFFADPDGDALTFSATSSDETRVQLDSSADTTWIKGQSAGTARVTATATDVLGLSTSQAFDVTVRAFVSPSGFDIDLGFHPSVSASARDVIRQAASTWESILAGTELSDVTFNSPLSCGGLTTTEAVGTVDELLILVTAESIDGPSGTLGYAGPCYLRASNGLPIVGQVVLDSEDMDRIPATTGLLDLAIHEIAHVLGFGILWDDFGLLADPSSVTPGADTHFTGAGAIAAFNAAGGASYTGARVPVQNGDPGPNSHWRRAIFPGEVMRPSLSSSRRESLSAITIESLADLGYTVNTALADPYGVSPDLPPGRPVQAEAGQILYLGDDILRVPIRVVDDEGRLMRVIPPR
ncbi:Ig-like domain-containing protein [Candidatus Palauibacter sp.]|uniref:Ig-like domain-containing protein n=1 Tax=Candidatus Palauibacter sp. TaxID=3101350 RepID=UPI003B024120